jgi:hypothetical protein
LPIPRRGGLSKVGWCQRSFETGSPEQPQGLRLARSRCTRRLRSIGVGSVGCFCCLHRQFLDDTHQSAKIALRNMTTHTTPASLTVAKLKTVTLSACALAVLASACTQSKEPVGSATAALVVGEQAHLFLGQPGIVRDVPRIQAGGDVPYSYWHITVPATAIQETLPIEFDLSTKNASIIYSEHFRTAPGCGPDAQPWTGIWTAGEPGVKGTIGFDKAEDGSTVVAFSFTYSGAFATPCGNWGTHTSSNRFAAAPVTSL